MDAHTELRFYNTLSRRRDPFKPINKKNVGLYVCGPTVYDYAHIGNARPAIVFDVLYRLLRQVYGQEHVTYVRNITDVEDKIAVRAAKDFPELPLNAAIAQLTETTAAQYQADVRELGCLDPTVEPRATDHIKEMLAMIATLIDQGHAYEAEGHVLFHVPSMPEYGRLANRSLDDMVAGARVEVAPYKKDAMDFVLWKPSGDDMPGWDSPYGRGRPGWHIECSAMAGKHLGKTFDIHGGGIDLTFPHHENELAQSCCANGESSMATVWMHNGFLQVEGEKMSKSLGNFFTIRELLDGTPGEALRLTMLKTQYRQPINWTAESVRESRRTLDRWYQVVGDGDASLGSSNPMIAGEDGLLPLLGDDLNTPEAITKLHRFAETAADDQDGQTRAQFKGALGLLGLGQMTQTAWRSWRPAAFSVSAAEIEQCIEARLNARAEKDWAEADRIRDDLAAKGIQLKDAKDAETGEIVTTWELLS